jgi:hypothetical protein
MVVSLFSKNGDYKSDTEELGGHVKRELKIVNKAMLTYEAIKFVKEAAKKPVPWTSFSFIAP